MLRSKKEKYILLVLILVLLAAVVWRVSLHQVKKESEPVRICVIAAKDSETEYGEIMAGIRDYARENQTEIRVLYQEDLTVEALTQMLSAKENRGIHGILLLYPEDFLQGDAKDMVTAELPVLRIGGADKNVLSELAAISCGRTVQYGAVDGIKQTEHAADKNDKSDVFASSAADGNQAYLEETETNIDTDTATVMEHLDPAVVQELFDGTRISVEVVNEYKMGYIAAKTLTEASGKALEDVTVAPLKLTAEDIQSGKYDSLLSE